MLCNIENAIVRNSTLDKCRSQFISGFLLPVPVNHLEKFTKPLVCFKNLTFVGPYRWETQR